jgi:hypothetical protein
MKAHHDTRGKRALSQSAVAATALICEGWIVAMEERRSRAYPGNLPWSEPRFAANVWVG